MAGSFRPLIISSYPRSGNTWLRFLLRACLVEDERLLDPNFVGDEYWLNSADIVSFGSFFLGSDLDYDEFLELRAEAIERLLGSKVDQLFLFKTHETFNPSIASVVERTGSAILHVVRDPRDVAVSLASYEGITLDDSVDFICSDSWIGSPTGRGDGASFSEHLGSWSDHVLSWSSCGLESRIVRFEDILDATAVVLSELLSWLNLSAPADRLELAVQSTRFERLKFLTRSGFTQGKASP
ncbi:MAG: sulfotransferase domain-containing protein, partial [Xanthomonadales bacterium]|nr:sulfotransferase domain-containing protein [Xanthomonadales bacterium]